MLPLVTSSMEASLPTQTFRCLYNLRFYQTLTRNISTSSWFWFKSLKSQVSTFESSFPSFSLTRSSKNPNFLDYFTSMAASAAFSISSPPFVPFSCKTRRPFLLLTPKYPKLVSVRASVPSISIDDKSPVQTKTSTWQWKFKGNSIGIYYEEHGREKCESAKNILMIPTISDVSTVEEWRSVAKDIVQRDGEVNWRATIVDWPGLGYSARPKMDYDTDVMEKFVVDFMNSPESPMSQSGNDDLVIMGGGHAATLAIRATQRGLLKPSAIAAVAPTWAGPLPIVFGRDSSMVSRYGMLRGTLRAPGVGWMMYNMLVSNEKSIESQYKSHVYADQTNVTDAIIQSRYELTKQKGSRYVPAAFLTGLLDPVSSREEFLQLFADLEGKLPVMVMSTKGAPKRSKAEMEALRGAKGVSKFVEVEGALLPQEEYPSLVAQELYNFLQETFAKC